VGETAGDVWALACAPAGAGAPSRFADQYQKQTGALPGPQAALAYAGMRAILASLSQDIRLHGRPSRPGLAAALLAHLDPPGMAWLQLEGGQLVAR
jgi:hypothetical protein